jgi:hypothetical protein
MGAVEMLRYTVDLTVVTEELIGETANEEARGESG